MNSVNIDLSLKSCREDDLSLGALVSDSSECPGFLFIFLHHLDVDVIFLLESVESVVHDFFIEVFSTQVTVTVGTQHSEGPIVDLEECYIKVTTTEVKD